MPVQNWSPTLAAEAVLSRLRTVRQSWDDAADAYFDPPRFLTNIQNCVTTSRTVTFILQANKQEITDFDEWYGQFTEVWAKDPVMVWAKNARNTIEKRGDLETYSQVRATIIASYIGGPETQWIPQSLFASPANIFRSVPKKFLIHHIVEHGTLLIERRWVDSELPQTEILEALAQVYGNLCGLAVSLLNKLRITAPDWLAHNRSDAWGDARAMDRAIYVSMKDGSVRGYRYFRSSKQISFREKNRIAKRYKFDNPSKRLEEAKTFRDVARVFFQHARVAMLRDGYHMSLCLFLRGSAVVSLIDTTHPDRASRYVIMRDLAKLSRIVGADGVILIGEIWIASKEDVPKSGFAVDAPNRREELMLNAVNSKGERVSLTANVERRRFSKKLEALSEAMEEKEDDVPFLLYPFMNEWGCLDHADVERGFTVMDRMGIEVPGVPESPPEQT
jgi:hypothetical protein